MTFYKLSPGQEVVIGKEEVYEYDASAIYSTWVDAPKDKVRMRTVVVGGYVVGVVYRFLSNDRLYVKVFMPTKQGQPRVRSKDRRMHTESGMFNAGTSDEVLLTFIRKVAFGEPEQKA